MKQIIDQRLSFRVAILGILAFLILTAALRISPVQAKPLQAVPANVYVCRGDFGECNPGGPKSPLIPYENNYVATVLKNEWGVGSSYMQALYAGDSPAL